MWLYIYSNVNHQEHTFIFNNENITVKKGQGIFSQKGMAKKLDINISTVHRILKYLENGNQIEKQTTTKFTLLTVINYESLNQNGNQNGNQTKNKLKTKQKQTKTNKNEENEENEKNDKNEIKKNSIKILDNGKTIKDLKDRFKNVDVDYEIEKMKDWLKSSGKKYKNYKAFARNWLRRNQEDGQTPAKKQDTDNNLIDLYKEHGLATDRN